VKKRNQKYLNAFGNNLRDLIDSKGLTPEHVAANGYLETKQVYRVINGEHSATLSIIYAIAKGLAVSPKELFDFDFKEQK
jgi:transcriptional regulator with XRE-family HTH domain